MKYSLDSGAWVPTLESYSLQTHSESKWKCSFAARCSSVSWLGRASDLVPNTGYWLPVLLLGWLVRWFADSPICRLGSPCTCSAFDGISLVLLSGYQRVSETVVSLLPVKITGTKWERKESHYRSRITRNRMEILYQPIYRKLIQKQIFF